ncbi:MAG TPA: substrate-binding domain-containing protein [Planctomycetota bacterium]|nr:substrate-binding domain-containing protein [Planctomycetota bacterium]
MIRLLAVASLFLAGSGAGAVPDEDTALRLGGSTTLLPVIAQCASDFMEKYETWDKADPALPKEKVVIFVTGGGSGFGVKALGQGTVHIGMISRDLKDEEKKALGEPVATLVGRDCVVFAVGRRSPLLARKNFTRDEPC